jgi:hypothetical protein
MRRVSLVAISLAVLAALPALAQAPRQPRPASELLAAARESARGDRAVLVAFHASWCGWCRRLEATLERPALRKVLDRHFVVQWLTVKERPALKDHENPGAAELYAQWTGGQEAGIPFCAVLDAKGALLGTSICSVTPGAKAGNIGYPGSPDEIKAFVALLGKGAPSLTPEETATLVKELQAAAPKD